MTLGSVVAREASMKGIERKAKKAKKKKTVCAGELGAVKPRPLL